MNEFKLVHKHSLTQKGVIFKPVDKYFHIHREDVHVPPPPADKICSGGSGSRASRGLQGLLND